MSLFSCIAFAFWPVSLLLLFFSIQGLLPPFSYTIAFWFVAFTLVCTANGTIFLRFSNIIWTQLLECNLFRTISGYSELTPCLLSSTEPRLWSLSDCQGWVCGRGLGSYWLCIHLAFCFCFLCQNAAWFFYFSNSKSILKRKSRRFGGMKSCRFA